MAHPSQRFRCTACGNEVEITPAELVAPTTGNGAVIGWPTPRCASRQCAETGVYPEMAMLPGPLSPAYLHVGLGGHRA